jgi:hypothetical protein
MLKLKSGGDHGSENDSVMNSRRIHRGHHPSND